MDKQDAVRVLVVDDHQDALDSLVQLLRRGLNCEVIGCCDGPACIELAAEKRPQLILLDIAMPAMDGLSVAQRLRQEKVPVLLVALTGYGNDKIRKRCREAGFDHHELKPINMKRLQELVSEARSMNGHGSSSF